MSNPAFRQSSIPNQNKLLDSQYFAASRHLLYLDITSIVSNVSLEADDVDGDESNDDELPSVQKLLSLTTAPSGNPLRSYSLNQSVQTVKSEVQRPLFQASRLLRGDACLRMFLNGRSFNICPHKHRPLKIWPRPIMETVRVGR